MHELIVLRDEKIDGIREHIHDPRFPRREKPLRLVSRLNVGLDLILGPALRALFFREQPGGKRGRTALGVETRWFLVERSLTIDKARKTVAAVLHFHVAR